MVCLLAGLAACSDDKNSEQPAPVPGITLDGTGSSLLFETGGGSQSVSFNATVGWTAETDQDWCSVLPASGGAGDASVTVTLEANDTPDERNATLVLTAGTATKRITLVQKQQDALNALSGGAVFSGQTKKRGFEAFMEKVTSVLLVLFFAFSIILAILSSK